MAREYNQDAFWDPSLFNLPTTASIEFDGNYPIVPLDPTFSFEDPTTQTSSSAVSETGGESSIGWNGQPGIWPSPDSHRRLVESPRNEPFERSKKILIEPQPHTRRRKRNPPSGEALERRRQQNRAAQLAFRDRSKKQVEEMRQELSQCVEYNQKMYMTMRELLERTEALKRDIEGALAMQPPTTSLETSNSSRTNSLDLFASPTSSNGSPFDYDVASI